MLVENFVLKPLLQPWLKWLRTLDPTTACFPHSFIYNVADWAHLPKYTRLILLRAPGGELSGNQYCSPFKSDMS